MSNIFGRSTELTSFVLTDTGNAICSYWRLEAAGQRRVFCLSHQL